MTRLGTIRQPGHKLPWYDAWELDEQLRHIERVLHSASQPRESRRKRRSRIRPLPMPHGPDWHVSAARQGANRRRPDGKRGAGSGVLTWLSAGLGTASLICGGILLGWSLATGRHELWNVGLPLSLAGQITLLAGLVLQIDRLWTITAPRPRGSTTSARNFTNCGPTLRVQEERHFLSVPSVQK